MSLCWRQLCPLANVIDKPDNSFCLWNLHLIYCRASRAGCCCRWFFLLGYALTWSQGAGMGAGIAALVPAAGCHTAEPRAAGTGDWVTRLKSLFAACWEALIQRDMRNSCLVFRWKSAMHNKKQLKVARNSVSGDARVADGLLSLPMKIMLINILQNWLCLNICFLWTCDYQLFWKINFGNISTDIFLWNSFLEV